MPKFDRARVVMSLLVAASLLGILYAFWWTETDTDQALPKEVRSVFPQAGEVALRQDRIGYSLASGWRGTLRIDRVEIPEDQVLFQPGINLVQYTPGPGTETGPLDEGRHCVTAVYWLESEGREAGTKSYAWCFQVH